ncbi:hypothetical protein RJZ56_000253 [Blastomyces dermatitidis]|uniref:Uncharacterized protein n=3 Tax=Blastomyces TaxID=229219 RepID=A0A179UEY8_BLAGS|nr:uncharacterized protein BDBG_01940 [Blastomyces gilchristii SLH14081]XP_031576774.1 hypothetical protein, variant 1 [Blastomyces gilchristii SLH14081]XP_031576775.1 hypothetical protein, variant 2 [Blastomyces gilchristii SLH14081]XP_045275619.1 uncharacterized protein BDCG_03623 [Blastomyces dermatitidis ER-3]XP_045280534.1 hypothetical protein, variant 1 [Blastomyces dermatitidis ER-3]XP_045280535.1 hypothetical protein, variant 2 [Blastomyces dermatitidis ER-3]EGE77328.1 hypothetical pr
MSGPPVVSHGRGGQGNINPDPTQYVDAEITRQGPEGDQGDGAYSAGRGGAGNIGSPGVRPVSSEVHVHDTDIVPELAILPSQDGDYHTGRGGQGNVHTQESKASSGKKGREEELKKKHAVAEVVDKLKNKLLRKK